MVKERKQEIVEVILYKIGRGIRATEEDKLGYIDLELFFNSKDLFVYKEVIMEASNEQLAYVKARYWGDDSLTHKEIQNQVGLSRTTYFNIRSQVLEGLYDRLEEEGYIKGEE